ncbi:MAG: threonylcarbamoyl-AMP synthase [Deltaproteobacteria bacterium]|nr:MAG: threonylcarbamoyl-AMP synthase [Deltaproteobacteria bacterium]
MPYSEGRERRFPVTEELAQAARIVRQGGIVAFPTETFYGLAADPFQEGAVERVFRLKGRPEGKPLLLVIADLGVLSRVVREVPPAGWRLIDAFWPGPLTLVMPAAPGLSPQVTAGRGSVGVRMSAHPLAQSLAARCGGAITATSANRSGAPPLSDPDAVRQAFPTLFLLDGGPLAGGSPSTLLDLTRDPPRFLRPGAVPAEKIFRYLQG